MERILYPKKISAHLTSFSLKMLESHLKLDKASRIAESLLETEKVLARLTDEKAIHDEQAELSATRNNKDQEEE